MRFPVLWRVRSGSPERQTGVRQIEVGARPYGPVVSDPTTAFTGAPRRYRPNETGLPTPASRGSLESCGHSDGRWRPASGQGSRRGLLARRLLVWLTVAFVVAPAVAMAGASAATPAPSVARPATGIAGAPSLQGYYIVGHGAALVAVGYVGFADVWTAAPNGSRVFSSAFYLAFFNLQQYQTTVPVSVEQSGVGVWNGTVTVPPLSESDVTISLPSDTAWTPTRLLFFGAPLWTGAVATPVSLLPNYIVNVGGLDLFSLTLVSFCLLNVTGGVVAARAVMRRAVWAPKFSALIWFHVLLAALGAAVFLDYQAIDATFAGWSPAVYPWVLFPMAFLWGVSLFNRAHRVQIQQGIQTNNGELGYLLTDVRIGRIGKRIVYIGESWGQFWARFWGHFPTAYDEDDKSQRPPPWFAPVLRSLSPTDSPRARRKAARRAAAAPWSGEALTKFPVVNASAKDDVEFIAHGKGAAVPEIAWPRLSIHTTVPTDPEYAPNPSGGPPLLVKPAGERRKLTWPHYLDPKPSDLPELEDVHYQAAEMVWAHYAGVRDLGRLYSKARHALSAFTSHFESRVSDEVYSELRTHYALTGRASSGISEEEAARRSASLSSLLSNDETKGGLT